MIELRLKIRHDKVIARDYVLIDRLISFAFQRVTGDDKAVTAIAVNKMQGAAITAILL